jgi:DUF3068 family protein
LSVRRIIAVVLIGLGAFFLALTVLLPTVAVSRSKKTPLNLDIRQVATGPAAVLDAATNSPKQVKLRALRQVRTDSTASDGTNTTVVESLCITVDDGNLPRNCLPSSDPRLLSITTDRVTADRRSAESVHVAKYHESINGNTNVRHQGLSYKWPIDAKKKTYQFYEPDLAQAFPALYKGTATRKGMTVYKYVSATGTHPYKVLGTLPGSYTDTRTVYVEPTTGAIIDGTEHQVQKLENGTVALETTLNFNQASIDYQAKFAQNKIDQLKLAELWGPLITGILGVLALLGGILLLRRAARSGGDAGGAHRDGDVTPDDGPNEGDPTYEDPNQRPTYSGSSQT